ncbi:MULTISPECIES: MFS transporter [unclassified Janthinobacterium]|uniref:MFS transporter n=1 Tax=unclassified Janthinobacterium TaxID=2610881 RepID=UPI00160CD114|nr:MULTISPECIES: MFS transporter [unclassified Janthinobacterium]MBB5606874.1 PAT family beta-lactamase induction signal transducer AmpG [Janthinobacterium sp. S3T4]MBB5612076.1 PAT family beta-lactamase induction signal transducer AmpG [Janthinobacterium sp. S3M3]
MTELSKNGKSLRSPITWVPTLYFAQGLPFYAVALVAGLMFKSLGVPNDQIARWTGLIGFAWVFKPLWSPFLELAPSKKTMVVLFQFLGGLSLGMIALALQTPLWFAACVAVLAVAALASSTHDIVCDGLYIASLSNKQQAAYAGWQGAFFNAGKFISLGGLVILAGYLEDHIGKKEAWSVIFLIIGAIMVSLAAYHIWSLPQVRNTAVKDKSIAGISNTLWEVLVDFLKKPGIWGMIAFIILFRAGEAQVQTIGPLFLREARELGGLGLSTVEVGAVYGTAGTVAFLLGSIGGGYFTSWLGLKRAMFFLILAMNLPNLVFYYLSHSLPTDLTLITAALSVEMFGYGFGFVGLILFMMQVVSVGKYQTAHYAFATGVMQLGFVLFKMISGDIQMALGYKNFFLWVLVSAIPVLVLSRFMRVGPKESAEKPATAESPSAPASAN